MLRQVSKTSEDVIPWWINLASGPTDSDIFVKNAKTSCLISASISSILLESNFAFFLTVSAVPTGTMPTFYIPSRAWISISNQIEYFEISLHISTISFLEYLGTISNLLTILTK